MEEILQDPLLSLFFFPSCSSHNSSFPEEVRLWLESSLFGEEADVRVASGGSDGGSGRSGKSKNGENLGTNKPGDVVHIGPTLRIGLDGIDRRKCGKWCRR